MGSLNVVHSVGSPIAQFILTNAKNDHSILCWDGSNSKEDLIENIKHYYLKWSGFTKASVTFEGGKLCIWSEDWKGRQEYQLCYDVRTGCEIYGRMRNCGFYGAHYEELKALLTAV